MINTTMKFLTLAFVLLLGMQLRAQSKLIVSPNPAKDVVTIKFDETINKPVTITIYDLIGNKISTFTYQEFTIEEISLKNTLNKYGIYLLNIQFGEKKYFKRLIFSEY